MGSEFLVSFPYFYNVVVYVLFHVSVVVMSVLVFINSDDTSDVVFADVASAEGEDVVPLEVPTDGMKGEFPLVVRKNTKALGKKVGRLKPSGKAIESSSNVDSGEIYVPDWKMFLTILPAPAIRVSSSSMIDDKMISKMIMASCNLCVLLPEGIARFKKQMQEYEFFSKKRDAMKANMAALKKEIEGFAEKLRAWQKKKEELGASLAQLAKDKQWLIKYGFQQVVTYLLHSSEFNNAIGDVYSKLLIHGRHQGYTVGYDAGATGTPKDKSPLFEPGAFEVFKDTVVKLERLTYPMCHTPTDGGNISVRH
ncbi:hypothetical protein Hanom_Chr14g01265241 [Helianthus anomalus]